MATASLHSIAERIESSNGRNTNHAECKYSLFALRSVFEPTVSRELVQKNDIIVVISELNKFMGVIKLERKQFETERERMLHFITEMDRYNREQRELRQGLFINQMNFHNFWFFLK